MRVLFTTWAWSSHYFPMVPFAWACRCAGHEVIVASQPALTETIVASGLPAVPVGSDTDLAAMFKRDAEEARGPRVSRAFGMFASIAEAMAGDLVEFAARWRPDVIVYDPITFAGPIAAAALGVSSVRHLWGPDFTSPGASGPSSAGPSSGGPPDMAPLAGLLARFGLDHVDLRGTVTVDPCPPSMQVLSDVRRRFMRYVPYNGPGIMPRWSRGGSGHLCVTWGTSTSRLVADGGFLPAEVIEAVSGQGAPVIVAITASQRHLLGELPAGVVVAESVPLHLLLPACAAVIHQGGAGTTLTSAAHGLPQLVIPQLADQTFNAQRVAVTGAGRYLPRAEVSVASVREQLAALFDGPGHRDAARELRREIEDQPSPATLAGTLEEMLARAPVGGAGLA
jgi:UDP:flavonoid glycosyltransferase YjiC (YdhE family)